MVDFTETSIARSNCSRKREEADERKLGHRIDELRERRNIAKRQVMSLFLEKKIARCERRREEEAKEFMAWLKMSGEEANKDDFNTNPKLFMKAIRDEFLKLKMEIAELKE
ncbi:uncharacterized protein G2W53_037047 [Senna tora]|uniref:Uncharacterized protein n=1 Tax=Senna tora TaxID=362788 RepID=A0A834WAS3_9FABA|nr:uncharacterized protein G2W53_037047 [Senna tora]